MMSKTILIGALMASVLLVPPLAASADSGHGDTADSASEGEHSGASGRNGGAALQPASLAGAWAILTAARNAIAGDVESGTLDDVHTKAEPLPELVAALLEQSGDLDVGKRRRVEGAAKQVMRVADALHLAADGGDAARTRKELSRLDSLLELIRAQYPPGTLEAGAHGHEDHSAAPAQSDGVNAHMQRPVGSADASPQVIDRILAFDLLCFEPKRIEVQSNSG